MARFQRWSGDIEKWKGRVVLQCESVGRDAIFELAKRIARDTPIDKGDAQGNWRAGLNGVPPGPHDAKGFGTRGFMASVQEIAKVLRTMKIGDVVYLTNRLPYMNRLEHGWSQQAPNGMVRVNVALWGSIVKEVARRALMG